MKYEELNPKQKEIVDKYFDIEHLNATLAETQKLIDSGLTIDEMAEHYGTDVQDFDDGIVFIDICTDKYTYSVFDTAAIEYICIGNIIEFWSEYAARVVFCYNRAFNEFINIDTIECEA